MHSKRYEQPDYKISQNNKRTTNSIHRQKSNPKNQSGGVTMEYDDANEIVETTRVYKKPIHSDFDLSGKLIEVEWASNEEGYLPTVPPDTAKGNTSPLQHACLNVMSNAAEYTAYLGTELGIDLKKSQAFMVRRLNAKVNFSRTKGGCFGVLLFLLFCSAFFSFFKTFNENLVFDSC